VNQTTQVHVELGFVGMPKSKRSRICEYSVSVHMVVHGKDKGV